MSGPGTTPAERAAADPTTETEAPGLLGTVGAIARKVQTHGHAHAHDGGVCPSEAAANSVVSESLGISTEFETARPVSVYHAAELGNVAALVELVEERVQAEGATRPAVLGAVEANGLSPWLVAAWRGHTTAMQWMLDQGAATNATSDNAMGASAAHLAVCGGHFETLHFLLERGGGDVHARDKQHCTPLIVASQYGEIMCAHLLLRHGAEAQAADENGDTAMHWVAYKGHYEFVQLLANGTATPPWSDYSQKEQQPLLEAAQGRDMSFNIDLPDKNGQTALHLAASRGSVRVLQRLCDLGSSPSTKDKQGRSPLVAVSEKLSTTDARLRCAIPARPHSLSCATTTPTCSDRLWCTHRVYPYSHVLLLCDCAATISDCAST